MIVSVAHRIPRRNWRLASAAKVLIESRAGHCHWVYISTVHNFRDRHFASTSLFIHYLFLPRRSSTGGSLNAPWQLSLVHRCAESLDSPIMTPRMSERHPIISPWALHYAPKVRHADLSKLHHLHGITPSESSWFYSRGGGRGAPVEPAPMAKICNNDTKAGIFLRVKQGGEEEDEAMR